MVTIDYTELAEKTSSRFVDYLGNRFNVGPKILEIAERDSDEFFDLIVVDANYVTTFTYWKKTESCEMSYLSRNEILRYADIYKQN